MKNIGEGKSIAADIFMLSEDLLVNLKNFNEFGTVRCNDLLVKNMIGITESRLLLGSNGRITFGRTIVQAIWIHVDRSTEIPNTHPVQPIHMLLDQWEGVRFLSLYIYARDIWRWRGTLSSATLNSMATTVKNVSTIIDNGNDSKGLKFLIISRFLLTSFKVDYFILKRNPLFKQRECDTLNCQYLPPEHCLRAWRIGMAVEFESRHF